MADSAAAPVPSPVPDLRDPDITPAAFAPTPIATGSQQLVRSYKSTLGRGLVFAVALHAFALGTYWFAVSAAAAPESLVDRPIIYVLPAPPPPIDAPVAPPDAPPPAAAPTTPVATGIPEPVPEAPPEATIARQDDFDPGDFAPPGTRVVGSGTGTTVMPPLPPPVQPPVQPPTPPTRNPVDDPTTVHVLAEVMPELIGGLASIRPEYPEMERRVGLEGRVLLQFVVNEDGSVSSVTVTRGVSPGLDAAAVAAVQRARFTPGMQRGRPVRVQFSLPVNFRLAD